MTRKLVNGSCICPRLSRGIFAMHLSISTTRLQSRNSGILGNLGGCMHLGIGAKWYPWKGHIHTFLSICSMCSGIACGTCPIGGKLCFGGVKLHLFTLCCPLFHASQCWGVCEDYISIDRSNSPLESHLIRSGALLLWPM